MIQLNPDDYSVFTERMVQQNCQNEVPKLIKEEKHSDAWNSSNWSGDDNDGWETENISFDDVDGSTAEDSTEKDKKMNVNKFLNEVGSNNNTSNSNLDNNNNFKKSLAAEAQIQPKSSVESGGLSFWNDISRYTGSLNTCLQTAVSIF